MNAKFDLELTQPLFWICQNRLVHCTTLAFYENNTIKKKKALHRFEGKIENEAKTRQNAENKQAFGLKGKKLSAKMRFAFWPPV